MAHTFDNLDFETAGAAPGEPAAWSSTITSTAFESAGYLYNENQILYSEALDNVWWPKGGCSITPDAIANPIDGAVTADELVEDLTTARHEVAPTGLPIGPWATHSVYAKASGRTYLTIRGNNPWGSAWFSLTTGKIERLSTNWDVPTTKAIVVDMGGGWYRCAITRKTTAPGVTVATFGAAEDTTSTSYTGNGSSSIYLFGAQVASSEDLTEYISTTSAAIRYDVPYESFETMRVDVESFDDVEIASYGSGLLTTAYEDFESLWSNNESFAFGLSLSAAAAYLLGSNEIPRSEEFESTLTWSRTNVNIGANVAPAPPGLTGYADALSEDGTAASSHFIANLTSITGTQVASVYARKGNRDWLHVRMGAPRAWFNLATGEIGTTQGNPSFVTMIPLGSGWYRCVVAGTNSTSTSFSIWASDADASVTFDGLSQISTYIFGACISDGTQLEEYVATDTTVPVTETENFDGFESVWSGNSAFVDTLVGTRASYDSTTPEDFEDFEDEWSDNENYLTDWSDVTGGPGATVAVYDSGGVSEEYEDFEETVFYEHEVVIVTASDGDHIVTINGYDHVFAASSNTATEIRNGLITVINNGPEPVFAEQFATNGFRIKRTDNIRVAYKAAVTGPTPGDLTIAPVDESRYWTQTGQLVSF